MPAEVPLKLRLTFTSGSTAAVQARHVPWKGSGASPAFSSEDFHDPHEPTIQSATYPVVLTTESIEAGNEDVVDANVNVVNTMYEELLDAGEIAPDALRSYYVDFYLTQSLGGGFAQYVFTAPEREEIDAYVREGLEGMGAAAHLDLFNRTVAAFDALTEEEADTLPRRRRGLGRRAGRTETSRTPSGAMEELDGEFESLLETEDITALNAAWLRGQEDLLVLDDDELDRPHRRARGPDPGPRERQAEAAEEACWTRPGFEIIIRELCDIAGHALQKITMGDPNYEHNGETTLAWHFTTDQGDFLMLEDDAKPSCSTRTPRKSWRPWSSRTQDELSPAAWPPPSAVPCG